MNEGNVIDFDLTKYTVDNAITDQWLAKNLDNNKLEWVRLTPVNSNYQTSFTETEIKQIDPTLMKFAKKIEQL